jgi:hypothetical protein
MTSSATHDRDLVVTAPDDERVDFGRQLDAASRLEQPAVGAWFRRGDLLVDAPERPVGGRGQHLGRRLIDDRQDLADAFQKELRVLG